MGIRELLHRKREDILHMAERNGARNVRIFGSVARAQENPKRDLDFLVVMEEGRSLFDLMRLEQELTAFLEHRTQVISEGGLNPHFRDSILRDAALL
jgi:predicted nucleotidyltransferase